MSQAPASPSPTGSALSLASRVDLGAASDLRRWFLACDGDATLDAAAVDVLTTPALQVLLAGGDLLRARGCRLEILRPSKSFLTCLAELGTDFARLTDGAPVQGAA